MKIIWPAILLLVLTACTPNGSIQGQQAAATPVETPAFAQPDSGPAPMNMTPQIVQPVTGGVPTVSIPLGGNIYQPVTGGPPVVGIPVVP